MGMKKKLFKAAAYAGKPALTFAMSHPKKAAVLKASKYAMEHMVPERFQPRRRRSALGGDLGMTAVKGLGAAAVAVPLGYWLGRRFLAREGA